MRKKKLIKNCIIASVVCIIISIIPLLISLLLKDTSNFEYSKMDVEVTIDSNGDAFIEEQFSIESNELLHYYNRQIIFNKDTENQKTNYSTYNQCDFDVNSFEINVKNKFVDLNASYNHPLNKYNGNKSDNIIAFENGGLDELGEPIVCDEQTRYCHSVGIFLKDGITPDTIFTMRYMLRNFVTSFKDVTGFVWKFVPSLEAIKNNVTLTINLPNNGYELGDSSNEKDITKIHYYGAGGTNSKFEDCSNNRIVAKSKKLEYNDEMEILMYFPSDILNVDTSGTNYFDINNPYFFFDIANKSIKEGNQIADMYIFINIAFPIAFVLFLIAMFFVVRHIYFKYDKELHTDFDSQYYRELPASYPPAIMGYLFNEEIVTSNDLNATLMDLIRRKYITIDYSGCSLTDKKPNYKLIFNREKSQDGLLDYEKYMLFWYFDVMANGSNEITLDQIDKYVSSEANALKYQSLNQEWTKKVLENGKQQNFFDRGVTKAAAKYSLLGTIAIFLALFCLFAYIITSRAYLSLLGGIILACAACFIIYTSQIRRKNQKANEEYVRWNAFKNFLIDFSHFEDYPIPGVEVWEHYLVYATSFGIADLVEKQLRSKFKELGRYDELTASNVFFDNVFVYMSFRMASTRNIGQQTITAAQAKRMASSGGKGGHGGFGGGSFHGGGGGHSSAR